MKNFKKVFKAIFAHHIVFWLIVGIALCTRLVYFRNSLTFFYDQARDALSAIEIWQGDPVKILGPATDFQGLYHGPAYWYLISPFYFFSGGNVWIVRFVLILINTAALFFIYDLSITFFKNKKVALLACFLFAISFEATQYARWLSNPGPAVLTTAISFWSLYKLLIGKKWALFTLLFSWGLSIQFQLFLVYQAVAFAIIWIAIKGVKLPQTSVKIFILSIVGFLATIMTYILSELKFGFRGTKILFEFVKRSESGRNTLTFIHDLFIRSTDLFYQNIWGLGRIFAGFAAFVCIIISLAYIAKNKKRKELLFLILWFLSPAIVNSLSGPDAHFINIGVIPAIVILTSFLLFELKSKFNTIFFLLLSVIIVGNANLILTKNKEGETLFTVQKQIILGDELKIIDWVYKEADGKPFKLNTITYPLYINTTWAFLFNWYGKEKYGYMPIWWGENQVDVPGSKIVFAENQKTDMHFLIIEPGAMGKDKYFLNAIKMLENKRSREVDSYKAGFFIVEKRNVIAERSINTLEVFDMITRTNPQVLETVE